jgi:hypothetical protein
MSFMDEFKSGSAPGLSAERLNEPFQLKSMVYDSVNNKIDLIFGRGRVVFLDTIVEKVLESTHSILTPTINTTYYIYLKNDGIYTHNTTGTTPAGALKLWAVSTGATVDALTKSDMRALIDASGRSAQDNLVAHEADTAIHTTQLEKDKLAGIEAGAQVNDVTSVAGKIGAVSLVKGDVGLGNVTNVASSTTATASQNAQRDTSGDIHARLFRSEYDTTNVTENVNLIMTQIDSASNNFLRPTTRRQLMEALKREGVETHRSGKDANGKFTTVDFKRQDGSLFMRSVLSGTVDANGNYPTRTETFYQVNGTTSIASISYSRTFDADGDLLTEVF